MNSMKTFLGLLLTLITFAAHAQETPAPETQAPPPLPFTIVKLQGLNKVTARVEEFDAPLGVTSHFGNLEIVPRACWQSQPGEKPENAALLDIWEKRPDEPLGRVFLGWMFSSSPALSAMEHAVYDITVLKCLRQASDQE